jgi:hypothetical protein
MAESSFGELDNCNLTGLSKKAHKNKKMRCRCHNRLTTKKKALLLYYGLQSLDADGQQLASCKLSAIFVYYSSCIALPRMLSMFSAAVDTSFVIVLAVYFAFRTLPRYRSSAKSVRSSDACLPPCAREYLLSLRRMVVPLTSETVSVHFHGLRRRQHGKRAGLWNAKPDFFSARPSSAFSSAGR